jgi:hypothetical protein
MITGARGRERRPPVSGEAREASGDSDDSVTPEVSGIAARPQDFSLCRYIIEQVIANFTTWRIMHTDYRRPIRTFPEIISAVIGLRFHRLTE